MKERKQKKVSIQKPKGQIAKPKGSRGKPKGLKHLKLPTPNIWTNYLECFIFLSYLRDIGQHFTYHAAGNRDKASQNAQTTETQVQEIKESKLDGNIVAARVAQKLFFYEPIQTKQVIYFFRQQNDPILDKQEIIQFIKAKFEDEIQKNNVLQALMPQPYIEHYIPNHPMNLTNMYQDISDNYPQNLIDFQLEQFSPNYNQQNQEKLQQDSELLNYEQNYNMPQTYNYTTQSQVNSDIQENYNPFFLEFIDSDLAIILNKIYFLLDKDFIFELILLFYAQEHHLNVLDVLTSGKVKPQDYPQIIKNAYISEVIKITECQNSKFYLTKSLQELEVNFNQFIQQQESLRTINEKINGLVQCFKSYENHQNVELADYGNIIHGDLSVEDQFNIQY